MTDKREKRYWSDTGELQKWTIGKWGDKVRSDMGRSIWDWQTLPEIGRTYGQRSTDDFIENYNQGGYGYRSVRPGAGWGDIMIPDYGPYEEIPMSSMGGGDEILAGGAMGDTISADRWWTRGMRANAGPELPDSYYDPATRGTGEPHPVPDNYWDSNPESVPGNWDGRQMASALNNPYGGVVDRHGLPLQTQETERRLSIGDRGFWLTRPESDKFNKFNWWGPKRSPEEILQDEQQQWDQLTPGVIPDNFHLTDPDYTPMSFYQSEGNDILRGGANRDKITDVDSARRYIFSSAPPGGWTDLAKALSTISPEEVMGLAKSLSVAKAQGFPASIIYNKEVGGGGLQVKGLPEAVWRKISDPILDETGANGPNGLKRAAAQPYAPAPPVAPSAAAAAEVAATPPRTIGQMHLPQPRPQTMTLPRMRPDTNPQYPAGYKEEGYKAPPIARDLNFNRRPVGKDVAFVQQQLASAIKKTGEPYYTGKIDGVGGPLTKQAVADWQRDNPWTGTSLANFYRKTPNGFPDKIVGSNTRRSLEVVRGADLPDISARPGLPGSLDYNPVTLLEPRGSRPTYDADYARKMTYPGAGSRPQPPTTNVGEAGLRPLRFATEGMDLLGSIGESWQPTPGAQQWSQSQQPYPSAPLKRSVPTTTIYADTSDPMYQDNPGSPGHPFTTSRSSAVYDPRWTESQPEQDNFFDQSGGQFGIGAGKMPGGGSNPYPEVAFGSPPYNSGSRPESQGETPGEFGRKLFSWIGSGFSPESVAGVPTRSLTPPSSQATETDSSSNPFNQAVRDALGGVGESGGIFTGALSGGIGGNSGSSSSGGDTTSWDSGVFDDTSQQDSSGTLYPDYGQDDPYTSNPPW